MGAGRDAGPERKQKPNENHPATGSPGVLSRPLVPLSRILGAQVATPGTLARPGWQGSGAVRRLHRARPKWATSGAAPGTGSPARALRRKRKRVRASGGDSEPPPPPGLATSRATRTPLGPALGPGPALAAAAAGAHAVSRTHHSGGGVLLTASKAAPPSEPLSDRTWGASRSHQAQPAQAASPLARRCPREGREGARAGWGHGASPALPARMLPPHLPRSGCRSPGSRVAGGLAGGRVLSRGGEVTVALFPREF